MPNGDDDEAALDRDAVRRSGIRRCVGRSAPRLVVMANRGPLRRTPEGLQRSPGGLVTAIDPVLRECGGAWVNGDALDDAGALPDLGYALPSAPLDAETRRGFYEGFSNAVLWPALHGFPSTVPLAEAPWDAYVTANEAFVQTALDSASEGDLFWVQDYHLMLAPSMLRSRRPSARIGWFCHVPWPGPEHFSALPWARELLSGLLGADVVGFHTDTYADNFLRCASQMLEASVDAERGTITLGQHTTQVAVEPIGIPTERVQSLVESATTRRSELGLRREVGDRALVLGVDRLDYTKGIPQRLRAFEKLLERDPSWVDRAVLVQLVVPSRQGVKAYADLREEIEQLVGRINGRFGRPGCMPVHYLYRSLPPEQLYGYYRAADIALVTPLRDGMNLVAQEYVFAQDPGEGDLVLSERAGAARHLADALLVNPYDVEAVADRLQEALAAVGPNPDRRRRMLAMRARVAELDVHGWASRFLARLGNEAPAGNVVGM